MRDAEAGSPDDEGRLDEHDGAEGGRDESTHPDAVADREDSAGRGHGDSACDCPRRERRDRGAERRRAAHREMEHTAEPDGDSDQVHGRQHDRAPCFTARGEDHRNSKQPERRERAAEPGGRRTGQERADGNRRCDHGRVGGDRDSSRRRRSGRPRRTAHVDVRDDRAERAECSGHRLT